MHILQLERNKSVLASKQTPSGGIKTQNRPNVWMCLRLMGRSALYKWCFNTTRWGLLTELPDRPRCLIPNSNQNKQSVNITPCSRIMICYFRFPTFSGILYKLELLELPMWRMFDQNRSCVDNERRFEQPLMRSRRYHDRLIFIYCMSIICHNPQITFQQMKIKSLFLKSYTISSTPGLQDKLNTKSWGLFYNETTYYSSSDSVVVCESLRSIDELYQ